MISRRTFCGAVVAAALTRFAESADASIASPAEAGLSAVQTEEVTRLLALVKDLEPRSRESVAGRVEALSAALLGHPFSWNPIGEGGGALDADPFFNAFRFDCMTFVEAVVALARSTTVAHLVQDVAAMRYADGAIRFTARHHFVTGEWLLSCLVNGVLQDVTLRMVPSSRLSFINYSIDRRAWWRRLRSHPIYGAQGTQIDWRRADAAELAQAAARTGRASGVITYLPNDLILEVARPGGPLLSGSVLLVVRPQSPFFRGSGTADPLSHCGLLTQLDGRWLLRTASVTKRRVIDVELAEYFGPKMARHGRLGAVVLEVLPKHRPSRFRDPALAVRPRTP